MNKMPVKILFTFILITFFLHPAYLNAQTATLEATLSLKDINGVKVPYQNGMVVPSFEKQDRTIFNLAGEWNHLQQ